MCCLFHSLHNPQWMEAMRDQSSKLAIAKTAWPPADRGTVEGEPGRLEVNVIFTDPQVTAFALKTAESLARNLGARVRLRAPVAVPYPLPVERPPVSVRFTQQLLSGLVCDIAQGDLEPTIDLYLCRDRNDALLRTLEPNSLVVIGGRKRWWPTRESRMADVLRSRGHQVVFVSLEKEIQSGLR